MIRKAGTPVFANGYWLIPVVGVDPGRAFYRCDLSHLLAARRATSAPQGAHSVTSAEICAAFPISFPRKLGLRDGSPFELGVVATRVESHQGRRVDVQYPVVLRERDGHIEAAFTDTRPDDATQEQICIAIVDQICSYSHCRSIAAASPLRSNWTVDEVLDLLSEYQRVDDGTDTLAARVVSNSSNRSVYFYLYGEGPDIIHFDLEEPDAPTREWDGAVARGTAKDPASLLAVTRTWLDTGGLLPVNIKNGSQS